MIAKSRVLRRTLILITGILGVGVLLVVTTAALLAYEVAHARALAFAKMQELRNDSAWISYQKAGERIRETTLAMAGPLGIPLEGDSRVFRSLYSVAFGTKPPNELGISASQIIVDKRRTIVYAIDRLAVATWLSGAPDIAFELFYNRCYLGIDDDGRDVVGMENGSKRIFRKGAADLDWSEAALLFVMTKAPVDYDPRRYPDRAKKRRDFVLDQLEKKIPLNQEIVAAAKKTSLASAAYLDSLPIITVGELLQSLDQTGSGLISVKGYLTLEFENFALYDSRESMRSGSYDRSLWLNPPEHSPLNTQLNGKLVVVTGTVHVDDKGHLEEWPG